MRIKHTSNRLLLPLFLLIAVMFSHAGYAAACAGSTNCYQVEVIVFQNTAAQALQSETWNAHPALPNTSNAISLQDNTNQSAYRLLPRSNFILGQQASALRQQGNYRILLHTAWQQPLPAPNNALPVHISAGSANGWNLNGVITLSRLNLINFATNIVLNLPVSELSSASQNTAFANQGVASFQIHQRQRMRINEIHYFDHPLFGMLVEVTRR